MPKISIFNDSLYSDEKLSPIATMSIVAGFSMMAWGLIITLLFA